MPQFDQLIFFNQIFWICIIFLIFYFTILKVYLPRFSSSIKTRYHLPEKQKNVMINKSYHIYSNSLLYNLRTNILINEFNKSYEITNVNSLKLDSENNIIKFFFFYFNFLMIRLYFLEALKFRINYKKIKTN